MIEFNTPVIQIYKQLDDKKEIKMLLPELDSEIKIKFEKLFIRDEHVDIFARVFFNEEEYIQFALSEDSENGIDIISGAIEIYKEINFDKSININITPYYELRTFLYHNKKIEAGTIEFYEIKKTHSKEAKDYYFIENNIKHFGYTLNEDVPCIKNTHKTIKNMNTKVKLFLNRIQLQIYVHLKMTYLNTILAMMLLKVLLNLKQPIQTFKQDIRKFVYQIILMMGKVQK